MRTSWKNPPEQGSTGTRLLWSLAALGAAAALAGLGTFASFTTSTAPVDGDVSTGTVVLGLSGTAALTDPITNVVPGDTIERAVDLGNNGSEDLDSITLTVASLSTDPANDPARLMSLVIDRCDDVGGWGGTVGNLTCTSIAPIHTASVLLQSHGPFDSTANDPLVALNSGGTDHLRFRLTFDEDAGDNYQGKTATLRYTFVGVQRDAQP